MRMTLKLPRQMSNKEVGEIIIKIINNYHEFNEKNLKDRAFYRMVLDFIIHHRFTIPTNSVTQRGCLLKLGGLSHSNIKRCGFM